MTNTMDTLAHNMREEPAMLRLENMSVNPREPIRHLAEEIAKVVIDPETGQPRSGGANSRKGCRGRNLVALTRRRQYN